MEPLRPIRDGMFELDGDDGITLVGGYSPTSGRYHFPLAPVCPYTGADDVETVKLSRRGTLWSWTAVTTAPPGYAGSAPYGFGVVELEEGLRVVGRLTVSDPGRLHEGMRMRLVADSLPADSADGAELVTWAFSPDTVEGPGD